MNSLIHSTSSSVTPSYSTIRSPFPRGVLLIALAVASFALSSTVEAVDPPPDGGYPKNNTAEGDNALLNLTKGTDNTAVGFQSLFGDTTGSRNTAVGSDTLSHNTTGVSNVAVGVGALFENVSGGGNIAVGFGALGDNTASNNTGIGSAALTSNSTGTNNVAIGSAALFFNNADENTAVGAKALQNNATGPFNTAVGFQALFVNNGGGFNTATGYMALFSNTGSSNTAVGENALSNNNSGSFNIALGADAGMNLTNGFNNIDIGNAGKAGESNTIRIGTKGTHTGTFIAGISGVAVTGSQVVVNSNGKLGVAASSARFKDKIKPMDKASEAILALQPVTFHYKHELDPAGIPQFGLVAEQVEKVNPDLVARDDKGKAYTVRYEAVNAMLLNEFLKEHRKVEEQESMITQVTSTVAKQAATISQLKATITQQQKDLQSTVAQQQEEIKALTASVKEQVSKIQKVSDQLEVSKPVPQIVVSN